MPKRTLTNLIEIQDFARGATFFGTGGGGAYKTGVELLQEQFEAGREIGWVDVADIPDDIFTASAFGMGSIAPKGEETKEEMKALGCLQELYPRRTDRLIHALSELERYSGKKIGALVPGEIGGGNSCMCVAVAAETSRPAIDGDYAGRAVPCIFQTGPYIAHKPLLPLASVDGWGDVCFIDTACNWRMAERIGKHLSMAAFLGCSIAGFLMTGADMKQAVFPATMTRSLEVGRLIRETFERGGDPINVVAQSLGGWVLCRGVVSKKESWDKEGYYWGYHTFTGSGEFSGVELKVFFKNENHICWRNGEVLATSPDIITVVDDRTGQPQTNNLIEEGMQLAVIGLKAQRLSRSPRGIETLGPHNFGLDSPYVPIEEKMREV